MPCMQGQGKKKQDISIEINDDDRVTQVNDVYSPYTSHHGQPGLPFMIAGTGKVLQEPAPRQSDLGKALSDLDSYSEGKSANRDKSPGVEELVDELMQMPKEFISIKHKKSTKNTKDCMVGGSSFVVDAPGSPFVEPRKDFSKLDTSLNLDLVIPEPKPK